MLSFTTLCKCKIEMDELPQQQLISVEFPGNVKDVKNALSCLDPDISLMTIPPDENFQLNLQMSSYGNAGPLKGQRTYTGNFLLRLRIQKKKKRTRNDHSTTKILAQEIVGTICQTFQFSGMLDYLFLPPTSFNIYNKNVKELCLQLSRGPVPTDLILAPSHYSANAQPTKFRYQVSRANEISGTAVVIQQECVPGDTSRIPAEVPNPIERILSKGDSLEILDAKKRCFDLVMRLMDTRKVWLKQIIQEKIDPELKPYFKTCLYLIAYKMTGGPFRNLWIKRGYDPRQDNSSYRFQVFDFRLPKKKSDPKDASSKSEKMKSVDYSFLTHSSRQQTMYSIADLQHPMLIPILNGLQPSSKYNNKTGWLTESALSSLRSAMKEILGLKNNPPPKSKKRKKTKPAVDEESNDIDEELMLDNDDGGD